MKFPAFYGTWRFITAVTTSRHLSQSWASSIQSILPHPASWRFNLILSSHLRLGLPWVYLAVRIVMAWRFDEGLSCVSVTSLQCWPPESAYCLNYQSQTSTVHWCAHSTQIYVRVCNFFGGYEGENDADQFQLSVNAAVNFLCRIPVDHLTLDSEGMTFLRNAGNRSPNDTASHLRRTESAIRLFFLKKPPRIWTAFFCIFGL